MIRCSFTGCGHGWWASGSGEVLGTSMWICFGFAGGETFASDCHKHSRIVLLIGAGTWLAILDSKIGPVVIDLERERGSGDCGVATEIFCHVETGFLFA